jgi:hypothetical protein
MAIILRFPESIESIQHFKKMSHDYRLTKGDIMSLGTMKNERTEELAIICKYLGVNQEICTSLESFKHFNFLLSSVFQN